MIIRKLFGMGNEATPPYLIAGLGNPGQQYRGTRHNVGFMAMDRLSSRLGVTFSRMESKALVAKAAYEGQKLVLAKPQTFMNLSGQAVGGLARFYKTPMEQIMIVYDDVDLPLGTLRLRPEGGSAGHKGMSSIIDRLGTQAFPRLRLGVGRPPGRMDAAAYVLQDFLTAEKEALEATLDSAVEAILVFIKDGLDTAMNRHNGAV